MTIGDLFTAVGVLVGLAGAVVGTCILMGERRALRRRADKGEE